MIGALTCDPFVVRNAAQHGHQSTSMSASSSSSLSSVATRVALTARVEVGLGAAASIEGAERADGELDMCLVAAGKNTTTALVLTNNTPFDVQLATAGPGLVGLDMF